MHLDDLGSPAVSINEVPGSMPVRTNLDRNLKTELVLGNTPEFTLVHNTGSSLVCDRAIGAVVHFYYISLYVES